MDVAHIPDEYGTYSKWGVARIPDGCGTYSKWVWHVFQMSVARIPDECGMYSRWVWHKFRNFIYLFIYLFIYSGLIALVLGKIFCSASPHESSHHTSAVNPNTKNEFAIKANIHHWLQEIICSRDYDVELGGVTHKSWYLSRVECFAFSQQFTRN